MTPTSLISRASLIRLAVAIQVASVVLLASSAAASGRNGRCPSIEQGSLRNVVAIGVKCRAADGLLVAFTAKRHQWKQRLPSGNSTFVAGQNQLYGWGCYASGLVQGRHVHVFGLVCTRGLRTVSATWKVA